MLMSKLILSLVYNCCNQASNYLKYYPGCDRKNVVCVHVLACVLFEKQFAGVGLMNFLIGDV